MSKPALIIFEKNPVLGKVKTRLAQGVGELEALRIYKELSGRIRQAATSLPFPCFVYFSEYIESGNEWLSVTTRVQAQKSLGGRMGTAIKEVLDEGFDRVVLMGSDIYGLTEDILQMAVASLESHDVVLGPAVDGGYYLIGLSKWMDAPFSLTLWSHSEVMQDTIKEIQAAGGAIKLLPPLRDIDHASDLEGTDLLL